MNREGKISIAWSATGIGSVSLDCVTFARVEWSEKRQRFCIEDSQGQCLRHVGSIKGMAVSKDEAVALATAMIRDGRMPSPEQARAEHEERRRVAREKRQQQPSEIRRREERKKQLRRWGAATAEEWKARTAEDKALPLYETLAEAFDFADPELWKSNSFAALRPRLVLHVRHAIAKFEQELAYAAGRRKAETSSAILAIEAKLARARDILSQLSGDPEAAERPRRR